MNAGSNSARTRPRQIRVLSVMVFFLSLFSGLTPDPASKAIARGHQDEWKIEGGESRAITRSGDATGTRRPARVGPGSRPPTDG